MDLMRIKYVRMPLRQPHNPAGILTADKAAGSIVRGLSRSIGNELDEFVTESVRSRAFLQRVGQPRLALPIQPTGRPTGSLRGQCHRATSTPSASPHVHRIGRHPQPLRDLADRYVPREPLRRLQSHRLTLGPAPLRQAASIRVPHPSLGRS